MTPSGLRICLLGGFRVSIDDQFIAEGAWRLRKGAALLKLLALAPSHRLHREQILDLLWPELDGPAAANNLHHVLHTIRRILNRDSTSSYLQLVGDLLILDVTPSIWVDVDAFEAAAGDARRSSDPVAYRFALSLYGGDLLPEDLYEDWAAGRREGMRSLYLSLLLEMAALEEAAGHVGPAIDTLQRAVSHEPDLEEAYRFLMRLYARSGQRHQALRQFKQLQIALRDRLDADPDDSSWQLYQDIQQGKVPSEISGEVLLKVPSSQSRHNLPAALTSFIGREDEMLELDRLLGIGRLVTVTGTGGSGKTRLALEVAAKLVDRYPDGIWLVELASLSDPGSIPQALARVLQVSEQTAEDLMTTLLSYLQSKKLLLVLDNCEHLVDACADIVHALLVSCPGLQVLTTSREPLRVEGEVIGQIPALGLPDSHGVPALDALLGCESIRLFLERVQYRQSGFLLNHANVQPVVRICEKLEGIPLAIELAAARVGTLSVEQVDTRLEDALGFLTSGSRTAQSRQQTLRGALDWSYGLLDDEERLLFEQLAVLSKGWDLETAEAMAGSQPDALDLLSRLVDKSLVVTEQASYGGVRYRFLEPVRQYAHELLVRSGHEQQARRRHAEWFAGLLELARQDLLGGPRQVEWLKRLEAEHDNLRGALEWCSSPSGDPALGLHLIARIWYTWYVHGHWNEACQWLDTMLFANPTTPSIDRAEALRGAGALAYAQSRLQEALPLVEAALSVSRELGDHSRAAKCLGNVGSILTNMGELQRATAAHEECIALYRGMGDKYGLAITLLNLGVVAYRQGDYGRTRSLFEESLVLYREIEDLGSVAIGLANLGSLALTEGDFLAAEPYFAEALEIARELGPGEVTSASLDGLATAIFHNGDPRRAVLLQAAAQALRESLGLTIHPSEMDEYQRHIEEARASLEGEAYQTLWDQGRQMRTEQAIELALSEGRQTALQTLPAAPQIPLTRREREIAQLVAQGMSNRRIAEQLVISQRTVDTHVTNILAKLSLSSRTQIADRALHTAAHSS